MAQHNHFAELGERPVGALLLQYSLPAIIAMVASSLYNIVDAIFIGQSVGKFAIAGLALTNPLMALTAAFGAMVGVGGSTLMSIRLGQKDYEAARRILGNVVILNVVMGLTLGVVLLCTLSPILRLFGASDNTLPYAHDYMRILLCGNVVTHLYYGLNAQLRSTNRPKLAMYSTFGSVLINAVLAWLFVMVLGWGIKGAAWSTLIAQSSMLLWQIYLFTRPGDMIRFRRDIFRPDRRIMREAIVIGLPQFSSTRAPRSSVAYSCTPCSAMAATPPWGLTAFATVWPCSSASSSWDSTKACSPLRATTTARASSTAWFPW